jgi:hypothetical protein
MAACTIPTACVLVMPDERAGFLDPGHAGHLAVPVLGEEAGRHRAGGAGRPARMDGGNPGAHGMALDQRGVADLDAGHVGDRIPPARLPAERYAE